MNQEKSPKKLTNKIFEGRAARICAVAVSVFLCVLTVLEFTALELELEIPVFNAQNGSGFFWILDYEKEEVALDQSAENVLLEDGTELVESTKQPEEQPQSVEETEQVETDSETEMPETKAEEQKAEEQGKEEMNVLPYYIRVNRKQNCITVYTLDEEGEYTVPYKAMICSTGLYNATPRGTFQLSTKYLWRELYGGVYGQYATRIHGGVLFHSVPYYKKSKSSLCTDKYNKLGQQASMGCIRLTVEDAKWIAENCPEGTSVEIYDDDDPGPLGKPEAAKIDTDSPNKGWDPTDSDDENPWSQISQDE